jgi:hypothetical protein
LEEAKKRRLLGGLLFAAMASLMFGIFYGAYHGPWDPRLHQRLQERYPARQPVAPSPVEKDRVTLTRGQPVTVGKNRLVFYGRDDDSLLIAVYILELDPEVAYYHRIPEKEASSGFRLNGQDFALVFHRKNQIQLKTSSGLLKR